MTKTYELVVLLTPEYTEQDVQVLQEKITAMVKKLKGSVTTAEVWGKRPLAYMIRKFTEGWYVQFVIEIDSLAVVTLDREIALQTDILRHLLVIPESTEVKATEATIPEVDAE